MAQKVEVKFTNQVIKVIDPKVNLFPAKVKTRGNRFKCWQILMNMDGSTVSEYYKACREAGIPCTANNPRDAVTKKLIELNAPKQETPKKVTATKKMSENVVALH